MSAKNPLQPIITDDHGTVRFKKNAIVDHLLTHGGINLHELAVYNAQHEVFSQDDQEQFAQLIGYSLSGFGSLSYVSSQTCEAADQMAANSELCEKGARIAALELALEGARKAAKHLVCALFRNHPDDLEV